MCNVKQLRAADFRMRLAKDTLSLCRYYIAKFSTDADKKMILAPDATPVAGCKGCPYKDAMMYKNYYGSSTYADDWVSAALAGGYRVPLAARSGYCVPRIQYWWRVVGT